MMISVHAQKYTKRIAEPNVPTNNAPMWRTVPRAGAIELCFYPFSYSWAQIIDAVTFPWVRP